MAVVRRAASAASASPAECKEEEVCVSAQDALRALAAAMAYTHESQFRETPARARIFKTTAACYFVMSLHHSLYDGVSIPFVFRDLAVAYAHGCAFCLPLRLGGTSADP